jgi:RNase P subunit RPR2
MIIPVWTCKGCDTINPAQVINIRQDQGTFKILKISITCAGCGKNQEVSGLKENDAKQPEPKQRGKKTKEVKA